MTHSHATRASVAAAGLFVGAALTFAQTPPAPRDDNQPPQQPGTRAPNQNPGKAPGHAPGQANAGHMKTPKYAQPLDTTLGDNVIQLCVDNDFKGEQITVESLMDRHAAGTLNPMTEQFENSVTSLRWNLQPGVLVVLFEEDDGQGQQLALWGQGQIPDLAKVDFNETASRWAWYNVGGGTHERSAADMPLPHGAQPDAGSIADVGMVVFDDQNFTSEQQRITGLLGMKAGEWNEFPEGKENAASSLRWNLPEGVIVILAAEDGGNDNIILFGQGQNPDLGACDFDNKASRWSWAYIGGKN